jgi:hypothetical protein
MKGKHKNPINFLGHITNIKLAKRQIIENYNRLWHIEKAFRISKTDL